ESLVTILQSLDCIVNDEDVIHYALEGLPEKYNQVCGYMHYENTFPDLKTARSLLITEEMGLKTKEVALPADSFSQMVLMAQTGTNRRPSNPQVKSWRPCFNFAKGSCRFGSKCRYAHDPNAKPRDIGLVLKVKNKARLVAQGYTQEEGIDYDEILERSTKLGLWYPKDSPFDLDAFSDSDYVVASHDRKSKTGGCQFLGKRLILWQCKKQTIVANSTTEAEYVAATNCYGQVLWIQNQILDYGFNFMNTKIYIDNESTICIVKNPVFHSKTKHIEIRHHFIKDTYEKWLIQVIKIHIDHNVADLLTKAFHVGRFQYLTASIGILNP
ncbi:putative ribonuclease H-like domain-containing protein, partial [Tanacetum coccineum]